MFKKVIASALLLVMFTTNSSFAHQQKEAYISLLFNQRSNKLEVSHRFLLHDAEHGLARVIDGAGDLSIDEATQKRFFEYVQTHFKARTQTDKPIELEPVGYEVEGKYFWVYQEANMPDTESLKLRHSALHELWPAQTNHINVEKDGWVKSVRIQKKDNARWQIVELIKGD